MAVLGDHHQLNSNGCAADFVEYKDTEHDAWTIALAASDFMEWIFDKKKK